MPLPPWPPPLPAPVPGPTERVPPAPPGWPPPVPSMVPPTSQERVHLMVTLPWMTSVAPALSYLRRETCPASAPASHGVGPTPAAPPGAALPADPRRTAAAAGTPAPDRRRR